MDKIKLIIIIIVCFAIGIIAIFFSPKVAENAATGEKTPDILTGIKDFIAEITETSSADEIFFIENPALKLPELTGHITRLYDNLDDYVIILGYSQYPLFIRKDRAYYPYVTVNAEGTEFTVYTERDEKKVFYYSEGGEIKKGDTPFAYEENDTDIPDEYTEDGSRAYAVYYGDIDKADIPYPYYYTQSEGKCYIYRFDKTLQLVLDKEVTHFKVFPDREDFLYSDDEYLYLYDVSGDESTLLTGMTEEHAEFRCDALTDFSEIYYCEWLSYWFWYYNPYPLYMVKPDGEKEILHERVVDYVVKDDTLYYLTSNSEFYMRKNGKSELLSTLSHNYGYISEADIEVHDSGYFIVNIHYHTENFYEFYATDSYKSNFFLSTDGKNFVEMEEYVK